MDTQKGNEEMSMMLKTNMVQYRALQLLNPDNDSRLELALIFAFGHEWRVIINEFLADKGTVPSEDDLLWCSSLDEHLGKDIRLIVNEIKQQL